MKAGTPQFGTVAFLLPVGVRAPANESAAHRFLADAVFSNIRLRGNRFSLFLSHPRAGTPTSRRSSRWV